MLISINCSFCQTIVPIENRKNTTEQQGQSYYYKDVNGVFNKFLGIWKYQDNPLNPTKIVEITFLKREKRTVGTGGFNDEIFARIKYTVNGVIVYDTYTKNLPNLMYRDDNIFGGYFIYPNDLNKINLHYQEPGKGGETGRLSVEYQNVNGNEKLY